MKALWSDESSFVLIFSLAVPIRLTLENPSIRDRSYQQQSYQCWAKERTLDKLILYLRNHCGFWCPQFPRPLGQGDPIFIIKGTNVLIPPRANEFLPFLTERAQHFRMHFPRFLLNRLGIGPYNQAVLLHQGGIGTGSIRPCKNISVFSQKRGKSCFFLVWRLQPSAE